MIRGVVCHVMQQETQLGAIGLAVDAREGDLAIQVSVCKPADELVAPGMDASPLLVDLADRPVAPGGPSLWALWLDEYRGHFWI